jgi:hypothetical protein
MKIKFTYIDGVSLNQIESNLSDNPSGYPITWAINDCAKKVGMTVSIFDRSIRKIELSEH